MTAPVLDRERLAKVLGLLGSAHDGEILAAAWQAERLRREAGATWDDVLRGLPAPPRRERAVTNVREAIAFCAAHPDVLTEWETGFIESLSRRQQQRLSGKQHNVLVRLVAKCRAAGRAAA